MSNPNVGYGTLTVIPSLRGFDAALKSQAGPSMATAGKTAGTSYGKSFGDGAQPGLLSTQTKLLGLAAGGALAYQSIGKASDLSESLSKSTVVFGSLSSSVERFGNSSATSLGLSKQQAIEAAATFGNLFTAMKIGQGTSADMSVNLVKLAADLASFNNTRPEDALEALRSGLSGEIEPLRRYGVNLTDVTLKAKAMELGLYTGKGALDAGAKAQAAYALILEQTKTAQGDFARTSGGLANQQRITSAEWKNAQATLGAGLVPAMKGAVTIGGGLAKVFAGQSQGAITAEVGLLALSVAYSKLSGPIATAVAAVRASTVADEAQAVAAGEAAAANTALGVSFGGGIAAAVAGIGAYEATTAALNKLVDIQTTKISGEGLNAGLEQLTKNGQIGGEVADKFGGQLQKLAADFKLVDASTLNKLFSMKLPQAASDEIAQFDGHFADLVNSGNVSEAAAQVHALTQALAAQGLSAQDVIAFLPKYGTALDNIPEAASAGAAAIDSQTAAIQRWHQANKDVLNSVTAQIDKNAQFTSATRTLQAAVQAYAENEATAAGRGAAIAQVRSQAAQTAIADANAYKQATDQLAQAHRSEESAARQVGEAIHSQQEAVRGVAAAERSVRDAEEARLTAIRNLATAEDRLQAAQRKSVDLVRDLKQAYDDARQSLQDMKDTQEGDTLGVERAKINLQEAIAAQRAGPSSDQIGDPNAFKKLALDVAQARLDLRNAEQAAASSTKDLTAAQQAGLDQSPEVQAAQEAIANNNNDIADAQQAVVDATGSVEDADQRIADAHHGVSEAQRAVIAANQAYIDAKQGVIDAHDQVSSSIEAVATAAQKSKDDQILAALEIFSMENDAKIKSGELRDAVITDFGLATTAANDWGLGLAGVNAWLTNITKGLDPGSPLRANIDALLASLKPTTPEPGTVLPVTPATGNVGAGRPTTGTVRPTSTGNPTPIYGPTGAIIGYRFPDGTTVDTTTGTYSAPSSSSGTNNTFNPRKGTTGKQTTFTGPVTITTQAKSAKQLGDELLAKY